MTGKGASADAAFEAALERMRLADPRPAYRERLRMLRESNPAAFAEATRLHDAVVLGSEAGDPVAAWIEYGRRLAELTSPGRMLAVDEAGRAAPFEAPRAGTLVLHVPENAGDPVLPAAIPAHPSAAQQATYDLLVLRKLAL